MKKLSVAFIAFLSFFFSFTGRSQVFQTRTSKVYAGASRNQDSLWRFDSENNSIVGRVKPVLPGYNIYDIPSLVTNPVTGEHFAVIDVLGTSRYVLGKIDLRTGLCTYIGDLADYFQSIAFDGGGTLFGITAASATLPNAIYRISTADASAVFLTVYGASSGGNLLSFCADNSRFYHWSNTAPLNNANWERFTLIGPSPTNQNLETLPFSGLVPASSGLYGALYNGNGAFVVADNNSRILAWDTLGNVSVLKTSPDQLSGFATQTSVSYIAATASTTICPGSSVLLTSSFGTSDYQWYLDGNPISGETNYYYVAAGPGLYNCFYADELGVKDSVDTGIVISMYPVPNVNLISDKVICARSVTTNAVFTGSVTGTNYTWVNTDPSIGLSNSGSGDIIGFSAVNNSNSAVTATVTVTSEANGCTGDSTSFSITVNPLPAAIAGASSVCAGSSTTLSGSGGGEWSASNTSVAVVGSLSGVVSGLAAGVSEITYTFPSTGCYSLATFTVNALPDVKNVTGIGSYCAGSAGAFINLDGSVPGIRYQLFDGLNPVSARIDGTGTAISFGTFQAISTYSAVATDTITGCSSDMMGTITTSVLSVPFVANVTGGGMLCAGAAGLSIGLDTSFSGVSYQLIDALGMVGLPLYGIDAPLNFGNFTSDGTYHVLATDTGNSCQIFMNATAVIQVNPLPTSHNVMGGGTYCVGSGPGFDVSLDGSDPGIKYQLYNTTVPVGDPIAGTGSALDFGFLANTGLYSVLATDTTFTTMCASFMTGNANVVANQLPPLHLVTGGGAYCAGGSALSVGLDNSDLGIRYELFAGSAAISAPLDGINAAIDFGIIPAAGIYSVVATDTLTHCTSNMSGSATVIVNPLPNVYTVIGGGSYCSSGVGVADSLSGSDTGISYQLFNGSVPVSSAVAGTGLPLSFGLVTAAGTYTVLATDKNSFCASDMMGNVTVSVVPLPVAQVVSVGGSFCAGGPGIAVGIGASETGVDYQLFNGVTPVGSPAAGTGGLLNFGLQTVGGNYTVVATNTATQCSNDMTGISTIAVNSLQVPTLSLSRNLPLPVCAGTTISFNSSATNEGTIPAYQWRINGSIISASSTSYTYVPANNDVVSLKLRSNALCAIPDTVIVTDTMHVLPVGAPTVHISANPGTNICQGAVVTFSATPTMGGSAPLLRWVKNHVVSGTGTTFTYTPNNGDIVYNVLTSNYMCRTDTQVYSNNLTMNVADPIVPSVEIMAFPGTTVGHGKPDTLVAMATNAGDNPSYKWYLNGVVLPGITTQSLRKTDFANRDSVTVEVTRGDACALSTFNSVKITVTTVSVQDLGQDILAIAAVPNPNKGEFSIAGNVGNGYDGKVAISLVNILGQVVYRDNVTVANGLLNAHIALVDIADGNYILRVLAGTSSKVIQLAITR